ncbi:MAG: sulfur carrier protein ThiS [Propionibacteriaceae bacterium]|nr:sulfur carrier protein ThiS [Propionibacteriaceae bacterium]
MTFTLNGKDAELSEGTTVRDVLAELTGKAVGDDGRTSDGAALGIAVAVDGAVVPRSRWATTTLTSGAEVEVVEAVQGG